MSETPSRPYIGGQAVIEGVMMRSPKSFVVAVRRPEGGVAVREQAWETLWPSLKFLRWPVFRGAVVLAESLHNGFSALKFSSEHGLPPDGQAPKKPSLVQVLTFMLGALVAGADGDAPKSEGTPAKKSESSVMLVTATVAMMAFFIALPHLLTFGVGKVVGPALDTQGPWFHLVDGVFRVLILVGYLALLSRTEDAKRLFAYHGAEHKVIWTYESQQALTVDNARPFTTKHPRCGTSFLFIVVGVAVALHVALLPLIPRLHPNELVNQLLLVLIKLPMAFPIAGLAYELQRLSAKPSCPRAITLAMRPGIWLQGITTKQPDDRQLEVALLSLDRALAREQGAPKSKDGVTVYADFAAAQAAAA